MLARNISALCACQVERASVDEAYIDLTEEVQKRMRALSGEQVRGNELPNTFVVGHGDDKNGGIVKFIYGVYSKCG